MTAPFSVILCEGFHDRSFLAGALLHRLGWSDPGLGAGGRRVAQRDRWGTVTGGGKFGFRHPSGAELRLIPCQGDRKIAPVAVDILRERATRSFDRLILNCDGDMGGDAGDYLPRICQSFADLLRKSDAEIKEHAPGWWTLDDGAEVRVLVWHASDRSRRGVPEQQCLERVLCAAAAEVWPERVDRLGAWLDERPEPMVDLSIPGTIPKSHAWTLMGGWFAERGCDDFFKAMWQHPAMADALQQKLEAGGAWEHLRACSQAVGRGAS